MAPGPRPLDDTHCEAWRSSYTHIVLISDSLNQHTKSLAQPVHFSNAPTTTLGMDECKSPPVTAVKLLRLSSVKSALAASNLSGMMMFLYLVLIAESPSL
jgi:hypothetical protein